MTLNNNYNTIKDNVTLRNTIREAKKDMNRAFNNTTDDTYYNLVTFMSKYK
mgnify:CR=1 FL=1